MRTLLIKPKGPGDYHRAAVILELYMQNHWAGEDSRARYNCVIYTSKDYTEPVAVWHSRNQITLHFGD